jgi:hypothetical protein
MSAASEIEARAQKMKLQTNNDSDDVVVDMDTQDNVDDRISEQEVRFAVFICFHFH